MISRRGFLSTAGGLVLSSVATGAYAIGIEPNRQPRVTRYRLVPNNWPAGLKLKLVVLADIHACTPWMSPRRIGEICEQANALGGDMILLLGDFLSGMRIKTGHVAPEDWARELARLAAPLGIHAVLGNHDWLDDPAAMAARKGPTIVHQALSSINVPVYDNRASRFEKDGGAFWLAGLADQIGPRPGFDDLPATLAQIRDEAPVILMAHEPDVFPTVPKRVSLTLSGHTHGGQIRLFGYSPVVPSRFRNRYAYGHIIEHDRNLIVSGGLGMSVLPIRFGSPPEIVVVELG
ncbi:metallophosphoesterase [Pararhizobium polonicum]|uniref:Metallophosphoesterase n=1 Tax=Pararhizobium polonicum TaxID=1612624 RepID=A0A1C7P2C4_9HYPH|nr:metallophosphoesterase [Pararhizobium polonicum]OBZ95379.1 metallophosphoesterase [Pararhizobium polonicum]